MHLALESGLHGDLLLDLDAFCDRPVEVAPHVDALAALIESLGADVVGGPLIGGALVAWAVAERLGLGFAATEREPEPSEVGPFPYQYRLTGQPERLAGHRVVVVDDVINAGSATVGTLSALRSANAGHEWEAGLAREDGRGRKPVEVGVVPALAHEDDLVAGAALAHPLADDPLGLAVGVGVGRVDEGAARHGERIEHLPRGRLVARAAKCVGTQSDGQCQIHVHDHGTSH